MSQQIAAMRVAQVIKAYASLFALAVMSFLDGDVSPTLWIDTYCDATDLESCQTIKSVFKGAKKQWEDLWSLQNITGGTIVLLLILFAWAHQLYYSYSAVVAQWVVPRFAAFTDSIVRFHEQLVTPKVFTTVVAGSWALLPFFPFLMVSLYVSMSYAMIYFYPSEVEMAPTGIVSEVINGVMVSFVEVDGVRYYANSQTTSPVKEMATSRPTLPANKPKFLGYICSKDEEGKFLFHGNFSLVCTAKSHYLLTALHVVQDLVDCYAVNIDSNRAVKVDKEKFLRLSDDIAFQLVPPHFASQMALSPVTVAQLDMSQPVAIVYGLGETKWYTSVGSVYCPANRQKHVFDSYYSSTSGSSGAPVLQNGKFVGVHNGARGLVDGDFGRIEPRNYFTTPFILVENVRSKHFKLEDSPSTKSGSWEEDDYDLDDILGTRTDASLRRRFQEWDLDIAEVGEELWSRRDKSIYREFETELNDAINHQGYSKNSAEVQAINRKYRSKLDALEKALIAGVVTIELKPEDRDFDLAGAQPAKQGTAKLGLAKSKRPSGTAPTSQSLMHLISLRAERELGSSSAKLE